MKSFISKYVKSGNQKELDRIGKIVSKINSLEQNFVGLADEDFPKKTLEFKEKIKNGQTLDQILPEAFALVREASKRIRNANPIKTKQRVREIIISFFMIK